MKHSSTWFALILIPLALLLSAANKSQSAKPLPRESAVHPTNQSAYDEQRSPTNHQVTNGRVIGSPVSSVQAEQQSADNRAATDGQNKPDWMVRLTFVLCVITALQALTFWIQYRAMVFSERAQIIVIAARAPAAPSRLVLAVGPSVPATTATPPIATAPAQPIVPDGLTAFAVGQHSKFQATILNVGKTPAYKFRCECWMELVTPPFDDFPSGARAAGDSASEAKTVYPNNPSTFTLTVMTDHPMSQTEFDEFVRGQRQLWVRVRVTYRDLFRKSRFRRPRFAEFGWRYSNVGLGVLEKYQDSN